MIIRDFIQDVVKLLEKIDLDIVYKMKDEIYNNKGRIFLTGNGGSCSLVEHICNDLCKRCSKRAYTLSNTALITCYSNDYGYEHVYDAFLKNEQIDENDILIAISSSGRSPNILNAIDLAERKNATIFTISGFDGFKTYLYHKIFENIKYDIHIDSFNYGEVEMTTEILLHSIVEHLADQISS